MSDPTSLGKQQAVPPPAPPLPPNRLVQLQRIIAPLGLNKSSRLESTQVSRISSHALSSESGLHNYRSPLSQTTAHRTGIPIAALDINSQKTHAILAGKEILKTVRIQEGKVTEDFNLRSSISSFASTHGSQHPDSVNRRRDYLPARNVRWSNGKYDHIIATAGTNGRISLYDVNAAGPRIELAWLHEHTGQVNKLDFDPFAGYLLLSASQDKSVRLWDIREPKAVKSRQRFEVRSGAREVRWSPVEPLEFAVCADGGIIQKWDARNPLGPKLSINGHDKACYSLDWHPDGRHVISGGFDKFIRVWDFKSDNRRQKPAFQLKAPQPIRNIRWRPPCWSVESMTTGQWQSTQIVTSYHQDDPRIHIWDLRRPWLPFRELDRYNTPANDLLWASKDLIWTVGDEGMFTQTDVTFAPQIYNELPPCAIEWVPDGEAIMFCEDRRVQHDTIQEDPALGFLSVPQERLSGEDGAISRSLTDDESVIDNFMDSSSRHRQSKAASSRSAKSQANTPPTNDGFPQVLSLDKAVFGQSDLFINNQVGMSGTIPGIVAEPEVVRFLATNYAHPANEKERRESPLTILSRLEQVFSRNAEACDIASMHRMAQSWRILGSVIVPELKSWADSNRTKRLSEVEGRKKKLEADEALVRKNPLSPLNHLAGKSPVGKMDLRPQNALSNLFKGVKETRKTNHIYDMGSTSNMTTPLAKPLPGSPSSIRRTLDTDDKIDNIAPLPPSVMTSHLTAAAAAKALLDNTSTTSETPPSSPESQRRPRAQRSKTVQPLSESRKLNANLSPSMRMTPQQAGRPPASPLSMKYGIDQEQRQEEKRTALRDYQVKARPIFTLKDTTTNTSTPEYGILDKRDSGDSFPMFSASTESSRKATSLGIASESPVSGLKDSLTESASQYRRDTDDFVDIVPSSPPDSHKHIARSGGDGVLDFSIPNTTAESSLGQGPDFSFGFDYASGSQPKTDVLRPLEEGNGSPNNTTMAPPFPEMAMSSASDKSYMQSPNSLSKPQIHVFNPVKGMHPAKSHVEVFRETDTSEKDLGSKEYLYADFRPIDLSEYEPELPFAWSALPLICHSIAFDMENGIAHGQFSAHLLMHMAPYFFHRGYSKTRNHALYTPEGVAERLMRPDLNFRIIESIFQTHYSFLQRMGLYDSMTEVRKICAELDLPGVYDNTTTEKVGSKLSGGESSIFSICCPWCQTAMPPGQEVCGRCARARPVCPICLSWKTETSSHANPNATMPLSGLSSVWAYCHSCGHSAHSQCLEEWFTQAWSDGACPTLGCDCDCGPGMIRQQRIEKQIKSEEEAKLIRGPRTASAKKDPLRAVPSPAVDKTRAVLRSSPGERATQSGDERGLSSRRVSSKGLMGGFGSQRKSVRLVTPGEEASEPSR